MAKVGVHSGTFHADEVTATALLLHFGLVSEVVRTRDKEILDGCDYVCDVGGVYDPEKRKFDHHQAEYKGSWSSAGMIWNYLKEQNIVDEETYHFVNESLILGVDAHDNGIFNARLGECTFSILIANFNPSKEDPTEQESLARFLEAVEFTRGHLSRLFERRNYIKSAKEKVRKAMETKESWLIFSETIPWMDSFFELGGEKHPAQFILMKDKEHWKVRGIPPSLKERMQVRCYPPKEWLGLENEALKKASSIDGAIFCHKGGFISVWENFESALLACKKMKEKKR